MQDLIVQESPGRGRGVFAGRAFMAGETIEVCPVIPMSPEDAVRLDATHLYNYYFGWEPDGKGAGITLGYGMLYNHSPEPNAVYRKFYAEAVVRFIALRAIVVGEEIFVHYQFPGATQEHEVWFEVK